MLNIVFYGPPGSGKGTQAKHIVDEFHLLHVSTGELLRDEIARESILGLEAKDFMNQGKLVPDSLVINMISSMVDEQITDKTKGVIFDGFPRTVEQAKALDQLMEGKDSNISCVISLEVGEEELIKRIKLRKEHSNRSDDADEQIIRQRIIEYNNKTKPVAVYYSRQDKLIGIKGEGSIDIIAQSIVKALRKVKEGTAT